ncbi:MAG: CusA/CzcA family heavy metal efflux RND transporter [Fimbriimonadaceae bacterium]|nr:CusA/CzcA family heavy metal efflux RND transporter [Chitinophagales bacterium]
MINKIIQFSINNKLAVGIFTLILIVWGSYALIHLPIDAVPDITNNQVQIITTTPTLATQEVEQFVTAPIERSMGNIPDITEIRSVSRFGLSVVTIVFEEKVDIYFARQLINERLKEAEEQIPAGVGTPELAPVSTGLGEVYQYVLHVDSGYEGKYNAMQLREMQDWIVSRQLIGTPGVAEINSFGGYLKQYEVAVDPVKLKSMNITIPELFEALEKNNENTGGAYIEKKPNAYYIRGIGLVQTMNDIENIVIKSSENNIPVLIKDVAKVQFGSAPRYGAQTRNGEGEVVGGIAMMLKGENSAEVVNNIKERISTIQQSLPEGVIIEPYLDRTTLVNRAIKTVETNLLEGALIVIFILVLFLGNLRAGLIVASVIPLAMLFAVGLMQVFGVSGNLMSLGAIDFGLIVDGAVIIVESVLHRITQSKNRYAGINKLDQKQMDAEVYSSASRMMNSATFGQIIILIVYIPILSLRGIEGKMFGPMAQTVGFAIIGALLLCLTYIPAMSALFLSKKTEHKRNFSDRMMDFFQRIYEPVIEFAIRTKIAVVAIAAVLFTGALILFNTLGGEFIPTLQEGDFAFHSILAQGSSLSMSIENNAMVEKTIMQFPEVKEVIAKTGSAEVPTDPMPPEATDMIIVLKDKSEWKTTDDYWELADTIYKALQEIPGVFFEINQPIQMRFNELMTGVRQDIAVKLFGENLDTLIYYGDQIASSISEVDGAGEPQVEKTSGLPQINITYNRDRMAQYGLNVSDVNRIIKTGFAGESAGIIFENERRFDLVVRLDTMFRSDITDVENLFIPLNSGGQIPLKQVAEIKFENGPAQISREDGKRRIVVGLNVNDRDVQSVVEDMQKKIQEEVKLPAGYYVTYGGQFENLKEASARLQIAVPVALLLIFIILYFTFNSIKQGLLIFSAIPLSAIGGVVALWLRDMPFSISAGVGFIALFGVAVLNGIVLISTFNQLAKEGVHDVIERVRKGTKLRLRPVLMTASVASLGFLPMALSNSAGAEVQRPLATVVIGGLISATALTLIVLPALYILFSGKKKGRKINTSLGSTLLLFIGIIICNNTQSQTVQTISLDSAIQMALRNNPQAQSAQLEIQKNKQLQKTSFDLPKTELFFENEDILDDTDDGILKIGIGQGIAFPTTYFAKGNINKQHTLMSETNFAVTQKELIKNVTLAYYQLYFVLEMQELLKRKDSVFADYAEYAKLRYETGETNYLEQVSAQAKYKEIQLEVQQGISDITTYQLQLMQLLNTTQFITVDKQSVNKLTEPAGSLSSHPYLNYYAQQIDLAAYHKKLAVGEMFPDFNVRYFNQNWLGIDPGYKGYSIGIGIPIAFWSYTAKIKAAETGKQIAEKNYEGRQLEFNSTYTLLLQESEKNKAVLSFYETTGLNEAEEILKTASEIYKAGEAGYFELMHATEQYFSIYTNYLQSVYQYNQTIININYFINQ